MVGTDCYENLNITRATPRNTCNLYTNFKSCNQKLLISYTYKWNIFSKKSHLSDYWAIIPTENV